ncbi:DNRLRE domain-containing protein [Chitinophaga pendula]|uniref:polysaccharide lyase family 8 super-sandwich domain-containing protein n=1 Tax=Chitinophaga TaxID=79328 RepID=UPI000BB0B741|nr:MULTISPECIES: polysaccharide lyase family 8 super-sandwich domain-containing protein [Chitinophaga]ASZ13140.1 hypothetical protein CK934_20340 [Chitinophaga sp. MD30]UCJ09234.1 DNRLRE domain-containing protein [Chitinophaga pendula]
MKMKYPTTLLLALLGFLWTHGIHLRAQSPATTVYDSVMTNIRTIQWALAGDTVALRNNVSNLLATMQGDSSWPDINYADRSQTNWLPIAHLDRLKPMVLAYTLAGGYYYGNTQLHQRISAALAYWYRVHPTSTNWYMQQIASPQRIGILLILLRMGKVAIPPGTEDNLLGRMAVEGGRPDQPGSLGSGANKLDIATHWIYRGCLQKDSAVLSFGVSQAYYPIVQTTEEGIQYDLSYQQHGKQLYIGGYGSVLLNGEIGVALYTVGTRYALAGGQLSLLSRFALQTYLAVIRGQYAHYNTMGRSISRTNAIRQAGTQWVTNMKVLDPAHAAAYDTAISRLSGVQPAGYGVRPAHTHYWTSDYSLHIRPGYSFDVRMVSTRTLRNENGNGEHLKGYFLADGATNLSTVGGEYYNIFPAWDWAHIPGVTAPVLSNLPLPAAWGTAGTVAFAGGVSDSLYGVSAYAYADNNYSINTSARKSWFYFDDEIVCLGANIQSTASAPVHTTMDQCLLNGAVTVLQGGQVASFTNGTYSYNNNLRWLTHAGVGYYFPGGGQVRLSAGEQAGTWKSINNTSVADTVRKQVMKLWLDHGSQPAGAAYAYILLPGKGSAAAMQAYDTTRIRVYANTDSMQVVQHRTLGIWQLVFYKAATFTAGDMSIQAEAGCVMILKGVGTTQVTVHLADPAQQLNTLRLRLRLPGIAREKLLEANMPAAPYRGSTLRLFVHDQTPDYTGPAPEQRVYAMADAYVNDGATAGTNYGSATGLVIKKDNQGYNREVYTKFPLPVTDSAAISKVTLQLKVRNANTSITTTSWQVRYVADNSWTESGINWNNKPGSAELLATVDGSVAGTTAVFDITAKVKQAVGQHDPAISLHTVSTSRGDAKTDAAFYSRENTDSSLQPMLTFYLKSGSTGAQMRAPVTVATTPALLSWVVAPNPASTQLYITSARSGTIVLMDAGGKIWKRVTVSPQVKVSLDVSMLPAGIYYLKGVGESAYPVMIVR